MRPSPSLAGLWGRLAPVGEGGREVLARRQLGFPDPGLSRGRLFPGPAHSHEGGGPPAPQALRRRRGPHGAPSHPGPILLAEGGSQRDEAWVAPRKACLEGMGDPLRQALLGSDPGASGCSRTAG